MAFLGTNYERIARQHLYRLFTQLPVGLESMLHAEKRGDRFYFCAFGGDYCFGTDMITLSGKRIVDPRVVLISLYAIHASPEPIRLEPFISFRDLPNSMPYEGAFRAQKKNSKPLKIPWTDKMGWWDPAAIFHLYYFPSLRSRFVTYSISLMKNSQDLLLVFFPLMRYLLCRLTAWPMLWSIHQRESLRSSVGIGLKKILARIAFPVHKPSGRTVC